MSKDIKRQQREIDELMSKQIKDEKIRKKFLKKLSVNNEVNIKQHNLRKVKTTSSSAQKNIIFLFNNHLFIIIIRKNKNN